MTGINSFSQGDAFGPDTLRAMSTALEEVCRMLKVDHDQGAREVMAVRIIELARRGECDPERLRDRMLREASATPSLFSTASMNDQPKGDQPKPAPLYELVAAAIAVLIMGGAIRWWM